MDTRKYFSDNYSKTTNPNDIYSRVVSRQSNAILYMPELTDATEELISETLKKIYPSFPLVTHSMLFIICDSDKTYAAKLSSLAPEDIRSDRTKLMEWIRAGLVVKKRNSETIARHYNDFITLVVS